MNKKKCTYKLKAPKFRILLNGEIIIEGFRQDIMPLLNVSGCSITTAAKRGHKLKGYEVVLMGHEILIKERVINMPESDHREIELNIENYTTKSGQKIILHYGLRGELRNTTFLQLNKTDNQI